MATPGYTATLTGPAGGADSIDFAVAVGYDFDPTAPGAATLENVMVWLDGRFVCQGYDFDHPQPRDWHKGTYSPDNANRRMTFRCVLARAYIPWVSPGAHELIVSLWTAANPSANIAYLTAPVTLPPRPARAVCDGRVLRSLFGANVEEARKPGIADTLKAAGVNTLTNWSFRNPADHGWTTIEQWQAGSLEPLKADLAWAAANGFLVQATGDDLLRSPAERHWLTTTPWAKRAVTETVQALADSGVCVGIEGMDEVTETVLTYYGDTNPAVANRFNSFPAGEPHRYQEFANFKPPKYRPADAFLTVADWVRSVPARPPLAWPVAAGATNPDPFRDYVRNAYESPDVADYCSRYWADAESQTGRPPPDGITTSQALAGLKRATANLGGRPFLCQVAATGPFYTKRVAGGDYRHGQDGLQKGGVRASDIVAQVWLALAFGAAGVRLYSYDAAGWVDERLNSPVGSIDRQTGSRPGDPRWPGVVAALNSVARREAALTTGHSYPAVETDGFVYGSRGDLSWWVNCLDTPQYGRPGGVLLTPCGEYSWAGGMVPPGGVVLSR